MIEFVAGLVIGLIVGANVALLAYSICVVGGKSDAHIEEHP